MDPGGGGSLGGSIDAAVTSAHLPLPAAAAVDRTPRVGQVLGQRYRLVSLLAETRRHRVFLAEQLDLGRLVAVKVVDASRPEAVVLAQEATALARLEHPHIPRVCDRGETTDHAFLGVEYVSGTRLSQVLARGAIAPERAAHVVLQVCSALSAAHQRGMVHGHLRPEHVVLTERGRDPDFVKLLGFGEPSPVAAADADGPDAGCLAPEVRAGRPADARSDVYAVGVLLYQGLTGRLPFPGDAAPGRQPPPAFAEAAPGRALPACLEQVCATCLQPDPGHRYADASEVEDALRAALPALFEPGGVDLALLRDADGQLRLRLPAGALGDSLGPPRSWLLPVVLAVLVLVALVAVQGSLHMATGSGPAAGSPGAAPAE